MPPGWVRQARDARAVFRIAGGKARRSDRRAARCARRPIGWLENRPTGDPPRIFVRIIALLHLRRFAPAKRAARTRLVIGTEQVGMS